MKKNIVEDKIYLLSIDRKTAFKKKKYSPKIKQNIKINFPIKFTIFIFIINFLYLDNY